LGLEDLGQRIVKGENRISEFDSVNKEVPLDWLYHLALLKERYKEEAVESLMSEINKGYPIGLFDWLFENAIDVYNENILIEEKLDKSSMYEFNIQAFDNVINELKDWYNKAICLYNKTREVKFSSFKTYQR